LLCLQVPATCPCPEPDQPVHVPTYHFLMIHLNIILPSSPWSSKRSPSFWVFHRSCQRISPGPRHMHPFRKKPRFYGEELLALCPAPKLRDQSLSAVRDCLFTILAATLYIGGRSSIPNLRTHHAVMTVIQLSWASSWQWWYCVSPPWRYRYSVVLCARSRLQCRYSRIII
jgi:hypothetical protein